MQKRLTLPKNGMHTNVFCVHVYVHMCVCGCASMCVYILEPPQTKAVHMVLKVLQIVQNLAREVQEKYQCGEEYSKHAEVRMSRISLSVCSLQTALMLFETEELEYCHTFCCTPAGLGTLLRKRAGVTCGQGFRS